MEYWSFVPALDFLCVLIDRRRSNYDELIRISSDDVARAHVSRGILGRGKNANLYRGRATARRAIPSDVILVWPQWSHATAEEQSKVAFGMVKEFWQLYSRPVIV